MMPYGNNYTRLAGIIRAFHHHRAVIEFPRYQKKIPVPIIDPATRAEVLHTPNSRRNSLLFCDESLEILLNDSVDIISRGFSPADSHNQRAPIVSGLPSCI